MTSPAFLLLAVPGPRGEHALGRASRLLKRIPQLPAITRTAVVGSAGDVAGLLSEFPHAIAIAAGGDGTARLIAAGLLVAGAGRSMAILPVGTGNALAHSIGVGAVDRAVAALVNGRVHRLDVMRTDRRHAPLALATISTGLEAEFIRRYAAGRGQRPSGSAFSVGLVVGTIAGATSLARPRCNGTELRLDGKLFVDRRERIVNVGLYNVPMYAAGRLVWPDADPSDGWGEAAVHTRLSAYLRSLVRGSRTAQSALSDDFRCGRWQTAELTTTSPIQMDGETMAGGTLRITIDRGALRILVPA